MRPCLRVAATRAAGGDSSYYEPKPPTEMDTAAQQSLPR
jgi:hypothetical protein